ncbi:hypothetical protein BDW75DRAFT_246594, partial [Aspergillus navahoensis]
MDLFIYNPTYQVWICTAPRCRYAVSPSTLLRHLRTRHRAHPSAATVALCEAALASMLQRPWVDPWREPCRQPAPGDPPVPGLPVYRGYGCPHCPYITRALKGIQEHRRKKHKDRDGSWGRGRLSVLQAHARAKARLAERVVSCQRFYPMRAGSHFFEVSPTAAPPQLPRRNAASAPITTAELIRAHVDDALQAGEMAAEVADGQIPMLEPDLTEVSPWLELTRWPEYLRGQDLATVASLGGMPDLQTEPLLAQLSASVQRLINQAYQAIRSGQINEFDQVQINTFHGQPGVWNRPIQIHLRPGTYRRYCQVWQQLICFAYRSSRPDQAVRLRHQLNTAQLAALNQMEEYSQELLMLTLGSGVDELQPTAPPAPSSSSSFSLPYPAAQAPKPPASRREARLQAKLDQACLDLSIALLDHPLKGELFDSTLVGFLA